MAGEFEDVEFAPYCDMRRHIAEVITFGPRVEHVLLSDYWVSFGWRNGWWRLTVPKGTRAAPSVPPSLQDDLPVLGGMWEPSIIHDWCYETRCFDEYGDGRKLADALFLRLMEAAGVSWIDRKNIKLALFAAGGAIYGANAFRPGCGPVLLGH